MFFPKGIISESLIEVFPRNIKGITKGLEIHGFGIVEYSFRSENGHMIALRARVDYVTGLPKHLCIISPQGIHTSEVFKINFIAQRHDDHYSYVELNLKEENPGWQNSEPVETVYKNYYPKNKLPNNEAIISNQI